jgi:hypothetical protein
MRLVVSVLWAIALVLYPACGGRKNPDIQPAAPTPPPMAPGDPEPVPPVGGPTMGADAAVVTP